MGQSGRVIVDSRSPFETGADVVRGAVLLWWQDFSMPGNRNKGYLDEDLGALTKRLSLKGIDRETPVVVLGNVLKGSGEDGRMAWMLKYLGVKKVQIVSMDKVRRFGLGKQKEPENKPYWSPVLAQSTDLHKKSFIDSLGDSEVIILDTRSLKEFSQNNLEKMGSIKSRLKAKLVNLEWKNFFLESGSVDEKIRESLDRLGLRKDQIIFVISNHGVRSGATTFALMELGYSKVENFMAGYEGIR